MINDVLLITKFGIVWKFIKSEIVGQEKMQEKGIVPKMNTWFSSIKDKTL